MKIIFYILFLGLFLTTNSFSFGSKIGKGELKFSNQTLENFIKYINHIESETFIVSKNGIYSNYSTCRRPLYTPWLGCSGGSGAATTMLKNCKKTSGVKCFIFAKRKYNEKINKKIIRWNNVDYEFLLPIKDLWKMEYYNISREEIIKVLSKNRFIDQ